MTFRITTLAVFCSIAFSACSNPPGAQTQDGSVADQPAHAAVAGANQRVAHAVAQAKIHRDFSEFDVAEKLLTDALAEPDATEKAAALQLLREVKEAAQNHEAAAAEVSRAETSSPPKHNPDPVSDATESQDAVIPQPRPADAMEPPEEIVIELEPLPEPVDPAERPEATDRQVAAAVREARSRFTPEAALEALNGFVQVHQLTDEQRDRIEEQRALFQERADHGLVRNGKEWITQAEAKKREVDADQKIEQWLTLVGVRNVKAAIEVLEDASDIDRNGIRADFTLGMLYSMYGFYEAQSAERHLQKVLSRSPRHISALNNLALSEVKQKEFGAAFAHWKMASEIAPGAPEVVHNLGRVVSEASIGKLNIKPMLLRRFTSLYAELATGADAPVSNTRVGWLYMPLILPKAEQDRPAGEPDITLVSMGASGTGFVVHENYIITNKHVIQDNEFGLCVKVTILDPNDPEKANQLDAEVVQTAANADLAILKCADLQAPALVVHPQVPRRGTGVLVVGYPRGPAFGKGVKVTRGIVTALPEAATLNLLGLDAGATHGNSGGPVCDNRGNVIGVLTRNFRDIQIEHVVGAIPSTHVDAFLARALEHYETRLPPDGPALDWAEVDAIVSPSTVLITSKWLGATMNLPKANSTTSNYLEDRSCSVCSGLSIVPCPRRNCVGGAVSTPKQVYRETDPITGKKFYTTKYVKSRCPTCGGDAAVSCPACRNGLDPTL